MVIIAAVLLGTILPASRAGSFDAAIEQPPVTGRTGVLICDLGWDPEIIVGAGEKLDRDRYRMPDRFRRHGTDGAWPRNGRQAQASELANRCPTRQLPLMRLSDDAASYFRFMSGIRREQVMAIRTGTAWMTQWRRITGSRRDAVPLPLIDFRKEMVLIAAMGPQGSGGYSVTIEKVLDRPMELQAIVRYTLPGQGCGAIAAVTSPMDIVRLPASPKLVDWVVLRQVAEC